jgi:hypothetical protein
VHEVKLGGSVLAAHLIHDGQKIDQRLLALGGVRRSRSKRFQGAVDGFVDRVPVRCGPRLQTCFCLVP